jgi:threonyl-tRNA synthetase
MKIEIIRHSLAHIMAAAVQEVYPGTKFGIGPAIENGFYYDFDLQKKITPDDLPKIEKRMKKIIKRDIIFKKKKVSKKEAKTLFKNQPYKLELIEEMKGKEISTYKSGKFTDLCKGPHLKSAKQVPLDSFKLTKLAGAYWRGKERNSMLTRIYGVAFNNKEELKAYLNREAEAEKRDHRLLGQKLSLFSLDEEVGAGLPLWHPKGAILRQIIEDFWTKEHLENGYGILRTPHIGNLKLWQTSGHWDFYRENMYSPLDIEKEKYVLKPMNCPFHIKIYKSELRSYRDLPIRWAELGTVYRYEKSGVLHGLTRVRGFTQDDAHVFCTPEQQSKEVIKTLKFGLKFFKAFGFKKYDIYLSTRPKKYIGSLKAWKKATNSLEYALKKMKLKYQVDPEGGVFYGPKIDIKIRDSLGRAWQCTTIQIDFNLPERFKMTYIDKSGRKKQPIMIHRALLGSLERFIGVLIENCAGNFPLWLSPIQILVIPIGAKHEKYAQKIKEELKTNNFRVELKDKNETVSKKIREGEVQKIPYMLVVGDKEIKEKSVRIRQRKKGDIGTTKLDGFIKKALLELEKKK